MRDHAQCEAQQHSDKAKDAHPLPLPECRIALAGLALLHHRLGRWSRVNPARFYPFRASRLGSG